MKRRILKKYAKQLREERGRSFYESARRGGSKKLYRRLRAIRRQTKRSERDHPELAEERKRAHRRLEELVRNVRTSLNSWVKSWEKFAREL